MIKPVYTCLWFNNNAKEAVEVYSKSFHGLKIAHETPMVVNFELGKQKVLCLNGGPVYRPNPSISLFVVLSTENEIQQAWDNLSKDGSVLMPLNKYAWSEKYGWLNDKFGVSWQLFLGNPADFGQILIPNILFTGNNAGKAREAINYYIKIFENSSVVVMNEYKAGENDVEGYLKHARFKLRDSMFIIMDSSLTHHFGFSEGNSFVIECENQEEIDFFWNKLTEGGEEGQCGWLKDKYGISWQVVPSILSELMSDGERAERVISAFLKMKKFEISKLLNA
jgi:predicted 3-demethylubiquinone-9 3-methyltransferase (glyoxalase superfamily)